MNTPKTYYAFSRNCAERIDTCTATGRKAAAEFFASRKQLPLRAWLKIYTTYSYREFDAAHGKNVTLSKDGSNICYKVAKLSSLVVRQENDSDVFAHRLMTRRNFFGFIDHMREEGWTVSIEH